MIKLNHKKIIENTQGDYKYHSIQIDINTELLLPKFLELQKAIPFEYIYTEEEDQSYGIEDDHHITLCYGIKEESHYFDIRRLLIQEGKPVFLTIGKVIRFSGKEDKQYDVLVLEVISEQLEYLHYKIRKAVDPFVSFPEYHPHMTIGYIKKGTCLYLDGNDSCFGKNIIINSATFCHTDKFKLELPFKD